jgi:hypothetical protein
MIESKALRDRPDRVSPVNFFGNDPVTDFNICERLGG